MAIIKRKFVTIFRVEEEITIKNVNKFKATLDDLVTSEGQWLILDLDDVSYLNSLALGYIAQASMNAKKEHKELVLAGVKPPLDKIFDIVKFHTFMSLYRTLEEAEAHFN